MPERLKVPVPGAGSRDRSPLYPAISHIQPSPPPPVWNHTASPVPESSQTSFTPARSTVGKAGSSRPGSAAPTSPHPEEYTAAAPGAGSETVESTTMDSSRRRQLASQLLEGYVSGPTASTEATARALAKLPTAEAVVLVEGISDQIAVETLAARQGRDLDREHEVVVPVGGAQAFMRFLVQLGPAGAGLRLSGLCDQGEERIVRRALSAAGVGSPENREDMERLRFHVCVEDLEDELIRAIGAERVERLVEAEGQLASFRRLQRQPAQR